MTEPDDELGPQLVPAEPAQVADDEPGPADPWLPLRAAAEQLGVEPRTLRRWAALGDVALYRTPGGRLHVQQSELDRMRTARPYGAPRNSRHRR